MPNRLYTLVDVVAAELRLENGIRPSRPALWSRLRRLVIFLVPPRMLSRIPVRRTMVKPVGLRNGVGPAGESSAQGAHLSASPRRFQRASRLTRDRLSSMLHSDLDQG